MSICTQGGIKMDVVIGKDVEEHGWAIGLNCGVRHVENR